MAAPEYVPQRMMEDPRSYKSPPRRPESWRADRPGEVVGDGQPRGHLLGSQGPDQGYVYRLLGQFADELYLADGEQRDDVEAGGTAVAMKRASLFGRAPVVHDLRVAFQVWGFLDEEPYADLVEERRSRFEGVANPHHYSELRNVVDAVPESTLRLTPGQVADRHHDDWRSLLTV